MMATTSGRRAVPQVYFGRHHVGGSDDLLELERTGRLESTLSAGIFLPIALSLKRAAFDSAKVRHELGQIAAADPIHFFLLLRVAQSNP
jgi:hypothetical protein